MSHHPLAVLQPVSTFIMEVLPWAASGAIGLYLLWITCLAPEPGRTVTSADQSPPATSSLMPGIEQASAASRHTWGIAARPDLAIAEQFPANSL